LIRLVNRGALPS